MNAFPSLFQRHLLEKMRTWFCLSELVVCRQNPRVLAWKLSRHWFCRLRLVWRRVSSNTLCLSNSLPWICLGRLNQQQRKLLWLGWKCENGRKKFIEVATNYCACWKLSTRFVLMNPAYFLSNGLRKMVQRRLSKKVFTGFGKNFHRSGFKCCFVQKQVKLTIARYKQCFHKSFKWQCGNHRRVSHRLNMKLRSKSLEVVAYRWE